MSSVIMFLEIIRTYVYEADPKTTFGCLPPLASVKLQQGLFNCTGQ